jgi:hypothetical protein
MTRYRNDLLDRLTTMEQVIDRISRSIEKIEVATIVREPSSKVAVDAYDGLRRQIVAAAGERMAHLHQLALFAEAVATNRPAAELTPLVAEWLQQAGVEQVTDPRDDSYFDVLGGTGTELRVLRVGYRDTVTGRPIVMGQAERVEHAMAPRARADVADAGDGQWEAAR